MAADGTIVGLDLEGTRRADVLRGIRGNDEIDGNRGDDQLFGGAGNDELDGDHGNDLLRGGDGRDELDGGNGNDRLTGGRGADMFEFETGDDSDAITDWGRGADRIELDDDFGYTGFRQVMRDATQVGDNVVFDFGRGTQVTVLDVSRADFDAGDFILL
jgi:Ca2+-binding RTX toxin-like protein